MADEVKVGDKLFPSLPYEMSEIERALVAAPVGTDLKLIRMRLRRSRSPSPCLTTAGRQALYRIAVAVLLLLGAAACSVPSTERAVGAEEPVVDDGSSSTALATETGDSLQGDLGTSATDPKATIVKLSDLVPDRLIGAERQLKDPSLEKVVGSNFLLELAWGEVTDKWKTAQIVDLIDKAMSCIYEVEAGSVGIYGAREPGPRVVAVGVIIPERLASVSFALCAARKAADVLGGPLGFEPKACASVYQTETQSGSAFVAFAVAGKFDTDSDPCAEVCAELPGCVESKEG